MRLVKGIVILFGLCLLMALSAVGVMADARINVWSHFGGDVLYCNHDQGCYAVNMDGQPLWSVPEATIVKAVSDACASNAGIPIAAGQGTYGAMTLWIACPDSITLVGFDEWGKQNSMAFTTDYLPVEPASSPGSHHGSSSEFGLCSVDLDAINAESRDGIHNDEGFDIWTAGDAQLHPGEFLGWSPTSEGAPPCDISDDAH